MTLTLSPAEVAHLHSEIGDIPKSHVGPKLMELYRRLDSIVGIHWDGDDTEKQRHAKKRKK